MPLPELIEIIPLTAPSPAEITIPGSKSITNRALVLAALAEGETTLHGALWSEDTEAMVDCLRRLGFEVDVVPEAEEPANRTMRIRGLGGRIPRGGTPDAPLELFVGNAGTAARFLTAMVCLGDGVYRLTGVPRMHERPQAALLAALRRLGYRIDAEGDRLPAVVHGGGRRPGPVEVGVEESSQFASALLLSAAVGGWTVGVTGANDDELPYVEMTRRLVAAFPRAGGAFQIEPDASSGSYFWAVNALWPDLAAVKVRNWPTSGWQIDADFPVLMPHAGEPASATTSRKTDLGDAIMTAIVIAPLATSPAAFTHLGVLRRQECERVAALKHELHRCGAQVQERGDTLEISPSRLHGAIINTYHDHRMAMCFATLGLKVPGMRLYDPSCVKKTFPDFFQKLAAPAPDGLGAEIWECSVVDGKRVRRLTDLPDLFAA
jgi:3-phosphoshikimate 1-carboxyvinyltransferase